MFVIRSDTTVTVEGDKDEFDDIYNVLMHHDRFYTLADYDAYIKSQQDVNEAYKVTICMNILEKEHIRNF